MKNFLSKRFFKSQDGAVTVDWVVLTAALVALCVGAMYTFNGVAAQRMAGTANLIHQSNEDLETQLANN
jgi:Flp pilus assembly protein TadG